MHLKEFYRYMQATAELALSVEKDIQFNDNNISNATILALNEFAEAAEDVADIINLEETNKKLN